MTHRVVALALLAALPACYSYVPLESGQPQVGQEVRVHVTGASSDDGAGSGGAVGEKTVDGVVLGNQDGLLRLSVHPGREEAQLYSVNRRDTVSVPLADVTLVERHKLDAGRTAVLLGIGAAGIAAAVIAVANANPSNSAGGGGGRPKNSQGLTIRIPVSIP